VDVRLVYCEQAASIITCYGLDCPVFETRLGRDFPDPYRLAPRSNHSPV